MTELQEQQLAVIRQNRWNRIWTYGNATLASVLTLAIGIDLGAGEADWWTLLRVPLAIIMMVMTAMTAKDLGRGQAVEDYNNAFFQIQASRAQ